MSTMFSQHDEVVNHCDIVPPAESKLNYIENKQSLNEAEFVLLYFTASWCKPCQLFSPLLQAFVSNVNTSDFDGNVVQVIVVSRDEDEYAYELLKQKLKSFWFVPFKHPICALLSEELQVKTIPFVVSVDNGKNIVSRTLRNEITKDRINDNDIVEIWRKAQTKVQT